MPHVKTYCQALKFTWIQKLLNPSNHSPWKLLCSDKIQKYGGDKLWHLNKNGLKKVAKKFNTFWCNVICIWADMVDVSPTTPDQFLSEPIWLNDNI